MIMADNYVLSDSVYVFPSTRRATKQLSARLFSESNVTGLLNNFVDTEGYVITHYSTDGSVPNQPELPFEFNIYGYYFKIKHATDILNQFTPASNGDKIYAYITLDKTDTYYELQGQDVTSNNISQYQGVKFTSDDPETLNDYDPETYKKLLIFQYNNKWFVPENSTIRFVSGFAFDIKDIDGGEI